MIAILVLVLASAAVGTSYATLCASNEMAVIGPSEEIATVVHGAGLFGNVVIGDPVSFQRKVEAIRAAGPLRLQVIADFDMTLTKFTVNGGRGKSTHALIQQDDPEYNRRRQELFEKYYPIEIDSTMPFEEKFKKMDEWWSQSHELLVEGGLTRTIIKNSVASANIGLRDNCSALFEVLERLDVPLLIFSAGLADIIEEVLRQKLHRTFKNIRVVSNRMQFDSAGSLVSFKGRIIHVLNKNEHALEMAGPMHEEGGQSCLGEEEGNGERVVAGRRNVVLLGDHLGDLGMSEGVDIQNRITIGFLNDNVQDLLEEYKKSFDVVILDDGPMTYAVELLNVLTSQPTTARQ